MLERMIVMEVSILVLMDTLLQPFTTPLSTLPVTVSILVLMDTLLQPFHLLSV